MRLIDQLEHNYRVLRARQVDSHWASFMKHPNYTSGTYETSHLEYRQFLEANDNIKKIEKAISSNQLSPEEHTILLGWLKLFSSETNQNESTPEIWKRILALESAHAEFARSVTVGYTCPKSGTFKKSALSSLCEDVMELPTSTEREAAWKGLKKLERDLVAGGLVEIVKERNRLARATGYSDFYDYQLAQSENFDTTKLFAFLDEFLEKTNTLCEQFVDSIVERYGNQAREGWNFGFLSRGRKLSAANQYYPHEDLLLRWGRTLSGMGVSFSGANITIDFLHRPGAHNNPFMECRSPALHHGSKKYEAASLYLSLSAEQSYGGRHTLETLFHEGGHCAHYANIKQPSSCFSHNISGALAETQAMFFQLIATSPAWMARYAQDKSGKRIPEKLILEIKLSQHRGLVYRLRNMVAVSYMERELYKMPESKLTTDNILEIAGHIDRQMTGLLNSTHPLMTLPHFYSSESAAYFHNYVLAEMAAYQTIKALELEHNSILNNPAIGSILTESYWSHGNKRSIFDLVENLTGRPLSSESFQDVIEIPETLMVAEVSRQVRMANAETSNIGPVDLNLTLDIVNGAEHVTSNTEGVTFEEMLRNHSEWLRSYHQVEQQRLLKEGAAY